MKLFSTSCETLFLGWDAPLLPQSVTLLRNRFSENGIWNLDSLLCVLPAQRAAERLGELLRWDAEEHDLDYRPPTIITVGQLPELLYLPEAPIALDFEQTLAWVRVLRACRPEELAPLVPNVPPPEPIGPWLELAGTLRRLHEDLAANRLGFREIAEASETDAEKRRWNLLSRLFDRYIDAIAEAGLSDPHWARQHAMATSRCATDKTVVMIGAIDITAALVAMLRCLDSDILALIAAPASQAFKFDEFGCIDTAAWLDHELPLQDHQLIAAGDVADQSAAVAEVIADYATRFSTDQVTVGVTDESHVGPVEVELRGCGVPTYRHLGWTVSETSVGRLLRLVANHLQRRTWQSLAALVRHADVHRYLSKRLAVPDWLIQVDGLLAQHYPVHVARRLTPKAFQQYPAAKAVADQIEDLLSVFSSSDRPIAAWCEVIQSWLEKVYHDGDAHRSDRTSMALAATGRMLGRWNELKNQLDFHVDGAAAIDMLSGRLSDLRIVAAPSPQQVEILGWLDLALDDAPALVVMGLNHPFVPSATTSDPFLPGSLRTRLRMADNDRRYARDVYAAQLMLSTRSAIRFIVGAAAADRSPTPPSRLLAAAAKPDAARRVRKLLGGQRDAVIVQHQWDVGSTTRLPIPPLPAGESHGPIMDSLSVTAFRDYLACPYRFFLRHVLKLKPLEDAHSELAANQFGDLVHASLELFGDSDDRHESDPQKIEALLFEYLDQFAAETYGDAVSTAVSLQVAQARRRLQVVARVQAQRVADGWRIHASEASVGDEQNAGIEVDGIWMGLKGRFDRIDRHVDGRWAILDYKTHGHRPEKKHLRKTAGGDQWIDLQLPLYRMMIPFLGIDAEPSSVQLGYFNVAEKEEETRINIAQFSETQMRQAEELIQDCIRRIRRGDFQPTTERIQFDDYGMILQTGVANRLLDQAELVLDEAPA